MMDPTTDSADRGEQVRITLTLSVECRDRSLAVPTDVIAVPAHLGRSGLSALVNHLLDRRVVVTQPTSSDDHHQEEEDDPTDDRLPAIPFEFIMLDSSSSSTATPQRLLRTQLEKEARRNGLSLEEAIPLMYFPAQPSPQPAGHSDSLPDWVAAVTYVPRPPTSHPAGWIWAGCYDGSVHAFSTQVPTTTSNAEPFQGPVLYSQATWQSQLHQGPIKCLAAASAPGDPSSTDRRPQEPPIWIATGSMDQTLRVHQIDPSEGRIRSRVECLDGHASAVGSVDLWWTGPLQGWLASGDWDGGVCLWNMASAAVRDPDPGQPVKKTKTGPSSASSSSASTLVASKLTPTVSLQAHGSKVSGVSFGNFEKHQAASGRTGSSPEAAARHLITGSWDHSIKLWDMERQDCLLTLNGSRVVSCLDTSYHSSGIVATGHPDTVIRLWDIRTDDSKESSWSVQSDFRPSHKGWISSVRWSPRNPYHLASTSHDGTFKLFDIRSSNPLHTIRAFPKEEKGFCLTYGDADSGLIFLGGTDHIVKQYSLGAVA